MDRDLRHPPIRLTIASGARANRDCIPSSGAPGVEGTEAGERVYWEVFQWTVFVRESEREMTDLDFRAYWDHAFTWEDYLNGEVRKLEELWRGVYARAVVPEWAMDRAGEIGGDWRMLVITEDWCGDASNTVPAMARLAEVLPNVQIRLVKRDENPELMDAFLTNGSRSIPMALLLRPDFSVAGAWGPRPAELQEFVLGEKKAALRPLDDIYRDVRRWYARDRGESTLRALLDIMAAG